MLKSGDSYEWSFGALEDGVDHSQRVKITLREYHSHCIIYDVYHVVDDEEFLYLEYYVKWDGCSNLTHHDGCMHFCGTQTIHDGLNTYFSLLYHLYYNAFVLMNIHPEKKIDDPLLPYEKEDHPDTIRMCYGEVRPWK